MNLKKISIVLVSLALVILLLLQLSFQDVLSTLTVAKPMYILGGFVLTCMGYLTRALRFYILLGKVSFKDLINVTCAHNFANTIMPARTGELSYIYLTKKFGVSTSTSMATLMVARSLDFIFVSLFLIISALSIERLPSPIAGLIWLIAGGMLLVTVFLIGILYFGEPIVGFLKNLRKKIKIGLLGYLLRKVIETMEAVKILRSKRIMLASGISSGIMWFFLISSLYFCLTAFNVGLIFREIVLISCILILLPILPFYGVAGFGTTEATATVLLMSFGVGKSHAIVASFGAHIICLIYTGLLGALGMYNLRASRG